MARVLASWWVAVVGLMLAGCGGGGSGPDELGGTQAPRAGAQGATERGGAAKASGPGGASEPEPEPVIRRLGPGERCDVGFGVCDVGLTCVDGVCCTSKCDGTCERCDLDFLRSEFGDEPQYSGNCLPIEDCAVCVRYVDGTLSSSGDGESWATALQTVQEGIHAAHQAVEDAPELDSCEVWVAQGTYYIYVDAQDDTVLLKRGAAVYGGFVGDEKRRSQRDWVSNATVLSGYDEEGGEYRVYHVVTGSDDAVLDGFTVTGGNAHSGAPHDCGGGMVNNGASPTVANCTFSGNSAVQGGAMSNVSSVPLVRNCEFSDNSATFLGGGMDNYGSAPTVVSCTFSGNSTALLGLGGAMSNFGGAPAVASCTFSGNSAAYGGGMFNYRSALMVASCTFRGNSANTCGGGMYNGSGGMDDSDSAPMVTSSILWGDTSPIGPEICNDFCNPTITYSDVEGGYPGAGNIDADPLFADTADDLHVGPGSPCIDAADGSVAPELDLDSNPRVDDPESPNTGVGPPWADMGAYEYRPPE